MQGITLTDVASLCTYLYLKKEQTVLLLLLRNSLETIKKKNNVCVGKKKTKNAKKKKNDDKNPKTTAKGCPASTFLQRRAIFTADFLGIDIEEKKLPK